MLAMCVRKPGDAAAPNSSSLPSSHVHHAATTVQQAPVSGTTTTTVSIKTRKQKTSGGLKAFKRGSKSEAERAAAELTFSHPQPLPPSSRTNSSHSTTTNASRVAATSGVSSAAPKKVRDDQDGHLIYTRGDRLESRCKLANHKTSGGGGLGSTGIAAERERGEGRIAPDGGLVKRREILLLYS